MFLRVLGMEASRSLTAAWHYEKKNLVKTYVKLDEENRSITLTYASTDVVNRFYVGHVLPRD